MSVSAIERGIGRVQESIRGVRIPAPSLRGVISNPVNYVKLSLAAMAGLAMVSCARQEIDPTTVTQEPNKAAAAATLAPGVGGEPIATFGPNSPNAAELNRLIDRFNKGEQLTSDELNRVNTAKAQEAKSNATSEAQKTPTPEAKAEPCGILPDKFCGSGEPVIRPGRNIVTSIRFKAPPGTPITSLFPAKVTTVLGKEAQEGKKKVVPQTGLRPIDGTIPPLLIYGDLTDQLVDTNDKGVGESDQVAKVGPTGEIFVSWSGYNPANKKTVSAQEIVELLKRFFPEIMQKQPVEVPLVSAGGGWNVAEPKFTSGKP